MSLTAYAKRHCLIATTRSVLEISERPVLAVVSIDTAQSLEPLPGGGSRGSDVSRTPFQRLTSLRQLLSRSHSDSDHPSGNNHPQGPPRTSAYEPGASANRVRSGFGVIGRRNYYGDLGTGYDQPEGRYGGFGRVGSSYRPPDSSLTAPSPTFGRFGRYEGRQRNSMPSDDQHCADAEGRGRRFGAETALHASFKCPSGPGCATRTDLNLGEVDNGYLTDADDSRFQRLVDRDFPFLLLDSDQVGCQHAESSAVVSFRNKMNEARDTARAQGAASTYAQLTGSEGV